MQRYNGQLLNQFPNTVTGISAAGAKITVRVKSTGALATLYAINSTGGATLDNPLTADGKGYYGFYAPDGVYTLDVSLSGTPQLEIQLQDVASLQSQFNDAVSNAGYIPVGTFAAGCTVSQANGVVSDGASYWRWDGALPKTVTAGSAPVPTGVGGWVLISSSGLQSSSVTVGTNLKLDEYIGLGGIFYPEQFKVDGEFGDSGKINRAITAANAAGGGIVELGGVVRSLTSRIILKRGVLLRGSGGCDYSLYPVIHGSVLKPVSGYSDSEVVILDSGLENLPLLSGSGMQSFAIDMDNITTTSKTAIKLKSASNLRLFKDITVLNNDNCVALEINEATVSGSPSGIATDGLEFINFFTYSKTAFARTNPVCLIAGNANEVTFRGGKFQTKAAAAAGTRAVDIYSGARGITFDGTAFAGCETLVNIVGLNGFSGSPPEWIRFFNGTFETYRYGINITSTGTNPIYYPRFITIDKSNRFITATGANPRKVIVDHSNGVSVELDEFFEGSTMLEITGNALACVAYCQAVAATNASTTSVVYGRSGDSLQYSRLYLQPTIAPTLLNSWVNGSPSNRQTAGYYKDAFGTVYLQGYLSGGTAGTVAFNLPAGYRPALGVEIAAASGGSGGRITVTNDGNVTIAVFTSFISLDGITFRAEA